MTLQPSIRPEERALKSRNALVWHSPAVPSWTGLFGTGAARRDYLAYLKKDGKFDLLDHVLFALYQRLPIGLVTRLGTWIGRVFVRKAFPKLEERARANLRRIRPGLDAAETEALIRSHFANLSLVHSEFPLLARLNRGGRIGHRNGEAAAALYRQGPLILVGLHIANWEISSPVPERLGIPPVSFYMPPRRASQIALAQKVRDQLGVATLPPSLTGIRQALRLLKAGRMVALFCDEEHGGRIMAPFFGRPPHLDGNLAIAARLARSTGARVMVFHGERLPHGRYRMVFQDETPLPSQTDPQAALLDDVIALNAAIEPLIRAHCGHWFYLHGDLS